MLEDYEVEQKNLISGTETLRVEVEEIRTKTADIQSFLKMVDRCADVTELTAEVARTFVERVVVHNPVFIPNHRGVNVRTQEMRIFLNFIGEYNPE